TLFDMSSPQHKRTLSGKGVSSVAFSPDGKLVAEGHADGSLCLWDVVSAKQVDNVRSSGKLLIQTVTFSPDSSMVAWGSRDGIVRLRSIQNRSDVFATKYGDTGIFSLAFSPDGTKLAVGTFHGDIFIWTIGKTNKLLQKMTGHQWVVHSVCF